MVFIIGQGQQGVLLENRETEFGEKVNTEDAIREFMSLEQ